MNRTTGVWIVTAADAPDKTVPPEDDRKRFDEMGKPIKEMDKCERHSRLRGQKSARPMARPLQDTDCRKGSLPNHGQQRWCRGELARDVYGEGTCPTSPSAVK